MPWGLYWIIQQVEIMTKFYNGFVLKYLKWKIFNYKTYLDWQLQASKVATRIEDTYIERIVVTEDNRPIKYQY